MLWASCIGTPGMTVPEVCSHIRLKAIARLGSGGNFPGLIKNMWLHFLCGFVFSFCFALVTFLFPFSKFASVF